MKFTLTRAGLRIGTAAIVMMSAGCGARLVIAQQPTTESQKPTAAPGDKYKWLEDIYGEKQLAWVKAENTRTAAVLENNVHFATLQADALKILESPERLAEPEFRNGEVYNGWQDAEHLRGIYRRTSLKNYLSDAPHWKTVLDVDALANADKQSWVNKGFICLQPENELCLVGLSVGGEDAMTLREIDIKTGKFVEGGFDLPKGKQSADWIDKDTLAVARDWGPGTISESSYPIEVRIWKRGEPLEKAREVYRGETKDMSVGPAALNDGKGHTAFVIQRGLTFFDNETYLLTKNGVKKLALPLKGSVAGLLDNQLILVINEDWTPQGQTKSYVQGSVLSLSLDAVKNDPEHLKPTIIFAPTADEFQQGVATTRNHLLITTLEHVQGRAYLYSFGKDGQWTRTKLPVADNQTVNIGTTSQTDDHFTLNMDGFLTPASIWLGDASDGSLRVIKTQKSLFDASNLVVEQLEATSKDGTKIPYFIVHRKDIVYDGSNPTLLNAYGGFQISMTPFYNAVRGKLWLEHGGIYVLANIRGGGEFGPAWHDAGLKTHRQRIYDDFYAVGADLVARKITSPQKLGIIGGSNGGLLMGVEFTQHPEMWNAVVIQVPLLDMLGYEHMSAGASWVGEFGTTKIPEERAFLASISPYNQLKSDGHYPVPLIFTTTKDDRVGPAHARKFAAKMEEFHLPFYYDEITEGGHGAGADKKQEARTDAVTYTYLMMKLMN